MSTLAVYDCMLFFSAASRPKRVSAVFELVKSQVVTLCLSPDVLSEIRDVLTRPKLVLKYPALTPLAVDAFLADCLRRASWFHDVTEHFVLQRDPKDSKYLNLAITASAPYVVTRDRDLLDLMNEHNAEGRVFRARFPDIHIIDPAAFCSIIREHSGD